MSVSGELLCSFELLKPLDSSALKSHIKKSRNKRLNMINSPVSRKQCKGLGQQDLLTFSSLRLMSHKATNRNEIYAGGYI